MTGIMKKSGVLLLLAIILAGCAGEEYSYVDDADLKPGPGLLSGDDGVFTIYRSTSTEPERGEQDPGGVKK